MGTFANGLELASKTGGGQVIAAFPDVCLSPPSPPAGPIPIPYPVTSQDSDTSGGSKSVFIEGKEIMLKDDSSFKKCVGDEAATKSFGMSVVTHNISGAVYFAAWSMDVKIEGKNAVRSMDIMTSNHASKPGSTPPWPFQKKMSLAKGKPVDPCKKEKKAVEKACEGKDKKARCPKAKAPARPNVKVPKSEDAKAKWMKSSPAGKKYKKWLSDTKSHYNKRATENAKDPCLRAMKCQLQKWQPNGCCPGQTPHHIIEKTSFYEGAVANDQKVKGCGRYDPKSAPCICVEGTSWFLGSHALMHTVQGYHMEKLTAKRPEPKKVTFAEAKKNGAKSVREVFPESNCSQKCLEAQLKNGHKGVSEDQEIYASPSGYTDQAAYDGAGDTVQAKVRALKGRKSGPLGIS